MSPERAVFLSYSSADRDIVEIIAFKLREKGMELFFDKWNLIAGERFIPELAEALEKAPAIVIFIGPTGRGPWQHVEVEHAINLRVRSGGKTRVIVALLPGASLESVPSFLK